MIPPTRIPIPENATAMYLTALSLWSKESTVSVSWTDGSATFGATFVGPSSTHVLPDKVFGLPIVTAEAPLPAELLVSFNFKDTMTTQHSISSPITTVVGPEGDSTQVQISGFDASDKHHKYPTTLTILFHKEVHRHHVFED